MKVFVAAFETMYGVFDHNPAVISIINDARTNYFSSYLAPRLCSRAVRAVRAPNHICDSGAHSFFTATEQDIGEYFKKSQGTRSMKDPDLYVRKYIGWIQRHWMYYRHFVELDIQELVGYEKVLKWRQWYKDAGVWSKIIPCFHNCNTMDEFKAMVDACDSRYVGVEGIRTNRPVLPYLELTRYCYDNDCRIHAFALTRGSYLEKYPFYSVDSSTLTYSYRIGLVPTWDPKTGVKLVKVGKRMKKDECVRRRVSPKLDVRATRYAVVKETAIWERRIREGLECYRKMEEYYTRLWCARGVDWDGIQKRLDAGASVKAGEGRLELQTGGRREVGKAGGKHKTKRPA